MLRDSYCLHCGETEAVSPNHRANRGMGGSKKRHVTSNLFVLCSYWNNAIEADPEAARIAKGYGWKLETWQDPKAEPIYDAISGAWYLLDDDYGRSIFER